MINEFLDNIQHRITDAFSGLFAFAFLAERYMLGVALTLGVLALTWFFGALPVIGNWIRGGGGTIVLLYAAFLAGMQVMYNHSKSDNQRYRDELKKLHEEHAPKPGSWFS